MKSFKEVKSELRDVRNFNGFVNIFGSKDVLPDKARAFIEQYEEVMDNAPSRLQVYFRLYYCKQMSQKTIADQWGYSMSYMKIVSHELCEYLQKNLA